MYKKIQILCLVLILSTLLLLNPSHAQEPSPEAVLYAEPVTTSEVVIPTPKAGVEPTSVFYKLDTWIEKVQVFLAREPKDKVEKLVEISQEKLAEIEKMKVDGEADGITTATERYIELGNEISDLFIELSKNDPETSEDVALLIALSNSRGQKVFVGVYENTDEANKEKLEEALKLNNRNIEDTIDYAPEQNREQVRERVEEQLQETRENATEELKRYLPTIVPEKTQTRKNNQ